MKEWFALGGVWVAGAVFGVCWLALDAPPPLLDEPIARLAKTEGEVVFRPSDGGAWFTAQPGDRLGSGYAIATGAKAKAEVRFDAGLRLSVDERSQVIVRPPEVGMSSFLVSILHGSGEASRSGMSGFLGRLVGLAQRFGIPLPLSGMDLGDGKRNAASLVFGRARFARSPDGPLRVKILEGVGSVTSPAGLEDSLHRPELEEETPVPTPVAHEASPEPRVTARWSAVRNGQLRWLADEGGEIELDVLPEDMSGFEIHLGSAGAPRQRARVRVLEDGRRRVTLPAAWLMAVARPVDGDDPPVREATIHLHVVGQENAPDPLAVTVRFRVLAEVLDKPRRISAKWPGRSAVEWLQIDSKKDLMSLLPLLREASSFDTTRSSSPPGGARHFVRKGRVVASTWGDEGRFHAELLSALGAETWFEGEPGNVAGVDFVAKTRREAVFVEGFGRIVRLPVEALQNDSSLLSLLERFTSHVYLEAPRLARGLPRPSASEETLSVLEKVLAKPAWPLRSFALLAKNAVGRWRIVSHERVHPGELPLRLVGSEEVLLNLRVNGLDPEKVLSGQASLDQTFAALTTYARLDGVVVLGADSWRVLQQGEKGAVASSEIRVQGEKLTSADFVRRLASLVRVEPEVRARDGAFVAVSGLPGAFARGGVGLAGVGDEGAALLECVRPAPFGCVFLASSLREAALVPGTKVRLVRERKP